MNGLLNRVTFGLYQKVTAASVPCVEPEPVFAERRPATGLFASLSAAQRQKALNYRGVESFGDPAYVSKRGTR